MTTPDPSTHRAPVTPTGDAPPKLLLSPWAIASCVLSLIALFLPGPVGFVLAIIAVVLGYAARREINVGLRTGDRWAGFGIAVGFLVIGLRIFGYIVTLTA